GAAVAFGCNSDLTDRVGVPDSTAVIFQTADGADVGGSSVTIRYNLQNPTAQPTDIVAEFSVGGGAFATATANGGDGVEDLATSHLETGAAHAFVWNSLADAGETDAAAVFRITPAKGLAVDLNLDVLNAPQPTDVTVTTPAEAQAGSEVTLTYFLKNARSQAVDVVAEYRAPAGSGAFQPASRNGGEGTVGLATNNSGAGRQHSFVWDTIADLPAQDRTVDFRVRPANDLGTAGTATFQVLNTPKDVTVSVTGQPPASGGGVIPVGFRLTSDVATVTDVAVEYAVGAGTFAPAASAGCDDPLTDLAASPAGTDHAFRWDSLLDVPAGATDVKLRIAPSLGAAAETNAFNATNASFTEAPEDLIAGDYVFPAPASGIITLNCALGTNPVGSFEIQPGGGVDLMTFTLGGDQCLPLPTGTASIPIGFPFATLTDVPTNFNVAAAAVTLSSPAPFTTPFTIGELTGDPDFSFTVNGLTV
ncbi:MAG: hypothetical protein K8I02_05150, partial [Candidatus Methylomirabilis sp.]|nr:hypothetical protein [Deltaproteobacteria bacterium]